MKDTTNTFADLVQCLGLGDGSVANGGTVRRPVRNRPNAAAAAATGVARKGFGGKSAPARAGLTGDGYTARAPLRRTDRIEPEFSRGRRQHNETFFCRAHVSRGDWLRLRRGQIKPDHTLDLHGLHSDHCQALVADLLVQLPHSHGRCLRLVHGKGLHSQPGAPTLKEMLGHWLPRQPAVLAICPRPDADGRSGSMDILLKMHL